MRQNLVPQSQVEGQFIGNSPIVIPIKRVVIVDPVFAGKEIQLRKAISVTEQVIQHGIFRKASIAEGECSVGIRLQFLVFYRMQPAKTKFELVAAMRPRHVIAGFIAKIRVLPGIVAWIPRNTVHWRTIQGNSGQPGLPVIGQRKQAGSVIAIGL